MRSLEVLIFQPRKRQPKVSSQHEEPRSPHLSTEDEAVDGFLST
jgi:hypothetical protein